MSNASGALPLDWSRDAVAERRRRYLSPLIDTFTNYDQPLLLRSGSMQYLYGADGRRYVDCISQNLTISVGHGHPAVLDAVRHQLEDFQHCSTMFLHPAAAHAAEELVATMPPGDWVVHFLNSGSEAVDLAFQMARVFTRNTDVVALRNAFHGTQLTAMAATGMASCRQPIASPGGFLHTENPDAYRGVSAESDFYLDALDRLLDTSGSGRLAALIIEPMLGYGGVLPLPEGYMQGAVERVRAHGGIAIVDEVQTGVGRLGKGLWAFVQHGVTPDIVVAGKGLSNGFPLSAVIARREIAEAMTGRRFFNTYGANPMSCTAVRAVLATVEREDLVANADRVGSRLMTRFEALRQKHAIVGDVRGEGLMIGVELVTDRQSKTPAAEEARRVTDTLREGGVVLGRSGHHRNVLRFSPPLCITEADADTVADVLDHALGAA